MNNKGYTTINDVLKKHFVTKVIKLSLDGGFTCPTRDGTKGSRGCIFCSSSGSGEYAGIINNNKKINTTNKSCEQIIKNLKIEEQIQSQIQLLSQKWKNAKYIAYFQNFTSTYADARFLELLYKTALEQKDVVGLAIATRADCIDDEVVELLSYFNKKTYLFVEIGLQSIHEKTEKFIRRGYGLDVFEESLERLNKNNIKTVVHTIIGLPTETKADMIKTYEYINSKNIWGVKIAQLNILKNTDLEKYYEKNPFCMMNADEYIEFVCEILDMLRKDIVVHRITGDGSKQDLIEPRWILNKRYVLNKINQKMQKKYM